MVLPEFRGSVDIKEVFSAFRVGEIEGGILKLQTLSAEDIKARISDLLMGKGGFLIKCMEDNGKWKLEHDQGQPVDLKHIKAVHIGSKKIDKENVTLKQTNVAEEIKNLAATIVAEPKTVEVEEEVEVEKEIEEKEERVTTKSKTTGRRTVTTETKDKTLEMVEEAADSRHETSALREEFLEEGEDAAAAAKQKQEEYQEGVKEAKERDRTARKKDARRTKRKLEDTQAPPTLKKRKTSQDI